MLTNILLLTIPNNAVARSNGTCSTLQKMQWNLDFAKMYLKTCKNYYCPNTFPIYENITMVSTSFIIRSPGSSISGSSLF
jgi:hypothetical protein